MMGATPKKNWERQWVMCKYNNGIRLGPPHKGDSCRDSRAWDSVSLASL